MTRKPTHKFVEDPEVYRSVDPEGVYTALLSGMPPMLTREEVAEFLRLDPKTVTSLCRKRVIPGAFLPAEGDRGMHRIPKLCLIKYLVSAGADNGEKG